MSSKKLDALDDELLKVIAKIKGHPVQKAVPQPVSKIYPVSAAAAAKEAARLEAEKESLRNAVFGQEMPDGAIYLCKYSPRDRNGKSLRKKFNVLMAKEDLPGGVRTYNDTVDYIAHLRNWNGYDGKSYANDTELYDALRERTYDGGWIIPTKDILHGKDLDGKHTTTPHILYYNHTGALSGPFKKQTDDGDDDPVWYWSCTEKRDSRQFVCNIHIDIGGSSTNYKDANRLSCRPVRLVPCK